MERELGGCFVQWFHNTKKVEELRVGFRIIRNVVSPSPKRASKLMAEGFATSAADVLIQLRGSRQPSSDDWILVQQFVLTALLLVWNWSQPAATPDWVTGSLLSAISPAAIQLAWRILNSKSQQQSPVSTASDLEYDIDQNLLPCGEHLSASLRASNSVNQSKP